MKKQWATTLIFTIFSIALFCLYPEPLNAAKQLETFKTKPTTIKILLSTNVEGALLETRGSYKVFNPENNEHLSSGFKGKRFYIHGNKEGVKWGESFLGIYQIQIVPTSPLTSFLINGTQYKGSLFIYQIEDKLSFVNEIDVETYLKAILPRETSLETPPTILDSIAIIARTNAYYTAFTNQDAFWHLQDHSYALHGTSLLHESLELEKAIDNTRYLVMTYENNLFPASWTQHCAGKTANYQNIYRKNTATPLGVSSLFASQDRQNCRWSFTIGNQELAKIAKINRVTGIDLFVDHESNKVYAIRVHDGTRSEDLDFSSFQSYLGKDKLKSNDFTVSLKNNLATFEGFGLGPGTGLCLYSAKNMLDRGDDTPKILSYFFPYTQLEKIRSFSLPVSIGNRTSKNIEIENTKHKKKTKILHR